MAIKDFGKGLKSSLNDAIDTVKTKAKEVELPDIKEWAKKLRSELKAFSKRLMKTSLLLMNRQHQRRILPASQLALLSKLYIFLWRQMERYITEKKRSLI